MKTKWDDTMPVSYTHLLIKNNFNGLVVNIAEEYNNHFEKVVEFIRKLDKEKREVVQQKANEYKEILAWKSVAKKYAELE